MTWTVLLTVKSLISPPSRHCPPGTISSSAAAGVSQGRRESTFVDQSLAKVNPVVKVNFQNGDGRPADGCQADQDRAIPTEMPTPFVSARVE